MDPDTSQDTLPDQILPKKRSGWSVLLFIPLVLVIALAGYLYVENQNLKNQITQPVVQTTPEFSRAAVQTPSAVPASPASATDQAPQDSGIACRQIDTCGAKSCLFDCGEAVEGFGTVTGYYHTYDKTDWGDVPVTCTAFIVQSGNKPLIDDLISWVKKGNAINRLTDDGKLIMNIDPPENFKATIEASTVSAPVSLSIVRNTPEGRGTGACTSFVNILKAE